MANENLAVLSASHLSGLDEEDYRSFCAALRASARGRAFLGEYARRNRHTDTELVLEALARLERTARNQAMPSEAERIRQDLRALLNTLHAARPQLDNSPGAIRAATLTSLIDFMQARIEGLLAPNRQPLSEVPPPEQPELPIPRPSSMTPPQIALVQGQQAGARAAVGADRGRPASGFDMTMQDLSRLLMAPLQAERQASMFDTKNSAPRTEQTLRVAPAQPRSTLSLLDMALGKPNPFDQLGPAVAETSLQTPQAYMGNASTAEPYELWLDEDDNQPSANAAAEAQAKELASAQIAALAAALLQADVKTGARVDATPDMRSEMRAEPQTQRPAPVQADTSLGLALDLGLGPMRQSAIDSIAYSRSNAPVTLDIDLDFDAAPTAQSEAAIPSQPLAQDDSSTDQPSTSYSDLLIAPPANLLVSVIADTSDADTSDAMPIEASLEAIAEAMAEAQAAVAADLAMESRTVALAEPAIETSATTLPETTAEAVAEIPAAEPVEMHAEAAIEPVVDSMATETPVAAIEAVAAEIVEVPSVIEPQTENLAENLVETVAEAIAEVPTEAAAELPTVVVADIQAEPTAEVEAEAAAPTSSLVARAAALAELATDTVQVAQQDDFEDFQDDDAQDDFQSEAEYSLAGELTAASPASLQVQPAVQQAAEATVAEPAAQPAVEDVSDAAKDALAPIMELSEEERIALFT
ncbi:MAG: hypothetical protein GC182_13840 [Rhodopseudomonas sp.]|nr:hypothetical protein [Rhodopseudomonas sp.]